MRAPKKKNLRVQLAAVTRERDEAQSECEALHGASDAVRDLLAASEARLLEERCVALQKERDEAKRLLATAFSELKRAAAIDIENHEKFQAVCSALALSEAGAAKMRVALEEAQGWLHGAFSGVYDPGLRRQVDSALYSSAGRELLDAAKGMAGALDNLRDKTAVSGKEARGYVQIERKALLEAISTLAAWAKVGGGA